MTTHIKYPMALIALLSMLLLTFSTAQAEQEISVEPAQLQDDLLDDAELRELVGPVALYPD